MPAGYSSKLSGYAGDARRRGRLEGADLSLELDNPVCGDQLRLQVKLAPETAEAKPNPAARGRGARLAEVRFECQGCLPARAAAAVLAEMLEGATLETAAAIEAATLDARLGGMPPGASHALALALEARDRLLSALSARG